MNVSLLDINVLLALAWPNHRHHTATRAWFATRAGGAWATCSLTQLGFIRLSSNPAFTVEAVSPAEAAALLRRWTERKDHRFLSSPPADAAAIYDRANGHQQVNDAWLVQVVHHHAAVLATLDRRMTVHALGGEVELIPTDAAGTAP